MISREIQSLVWIESLKDQTTGLTFYRQTNFGPLQWMKIKVGITSGQLILRAVKAVYENNEAVADNYLEAHGMSDEKAFNKETWTKARF